jgi:hypothetical protein
MAGAVHFGSSYGDVFFGSSIRCPGVVLPYLGYLFLATRKGEGKAYQGGRKNKKGPFNAI